MPNAAHNLLWNRLLAALKARNALPPDPGNRTPLEIARFADQRLRLNLAVPFVEGYYLERRYGGNVSKWSEAQAEAMILDIESISPLFSFQAEAGDSPVAASNSSPLGVAGTFSRAEGFKPAVNEPVQDESQAWGTEYVPESRPATRPAHDVTEEGRRRQEENARRAAVEERKRRIEEEGQQRERDKEERHRQREEAERREAEERDRRTEESQRLLEEEARLRAEVEERRVAADARRLRENEKDSIGRRKREAAEEQARSISEKELSRAKYRQRHAWMDRNCVAQKYLWRSWAIFLLVWLVWTGAFSVSLENWAHRGGGAWIFDLMILWCLQTEHLIGDVESMGDLIKKFVFAGAFGVGIVLLGAAINLVILVGGFENQQDIFSSKFLFTLAISVAVPLTLFILSYVNALLMYADLKD